MVRQVWPCLAALLCFTVGCGTGATVVTGAQSAQVPDPAPGTVNAALLRFDLGVGTPAPVLHQTNGYRPPKTAVFVAGVAPDPTLPNGYVGLAAIADFKGQGQQAQRRLGAGVAASQEFSIEFSGNAAYARNEVASYDGLPKHGGWTVSWYSTSSGSRGAQVAQDGARLLDEIASQLRGSPSPALLAALAGQPAPPVAAIGPPESPEDAAGAPVGSPGSGFAGGFAAGGGSGTGASAATAAPGPALPPWAQALLFPSSASGPAGPVPGESPTSSPPDQPPAAPSPNPGTPTPSPSPSPLPSPTRPPGPQVTATVVTVNRGPGVLDPGTVVNVSTSCPGGTAMTGGGAVAASPSGEAASRGLVLVNTMPVGANGSASSFWGVGATPAGAAVADAVTEDFAVCLISVVGSLTNVIATASLPGPSSASPIVTATATCPAGMVLVGGGGGVQAPAGSAPSVTLTASYPGTPRGGVLTSGGPSAWSVVGVAGPGATGATTSATAVCVAASTVASPRIVTAAAPVPALSTASLPTFATASCPAGSLLLSGGFRIDGGPVPDAHVRGSYPSGSDAFPVSDAPVAGSWSSIVEGDGPTPSASRAFALCA